LIENGQVAQQFYTFNSGGYSFKTPSLGTYTVDIDTTGLPLSIACPSTDSYIVHLSGTDSVATGQNFSVKCSNYDCGVLSIYGRHFRPGQYTTVDIVSGDIALLEYNAHCGAGIGGTVTTIINAPAHYVSSVYGSLVPSSISGDTLTYSLSDLDSLQMGSLSIVVATDTNAVVGTDVCFTTIITPSVPDMNPANDMLMQCFSIVNSWDPNEKSVYPLDTFAADQWLTYTVEFQNTGTDTAYTVVVRDTLSPYLDASSFQYIASDHKAVIQLMGNAMTFTFPRINLVDSATNPAKSKGWIQYKVKAKSNLPLNTQVKNTAYIYFDLNPAVVTNTTVNTVAAPSGISTIANSYAVRLYPNPNKGAFTLQTVNGQQSMNSFTITDMLGNVVMTHMITADRQAIEMPADAAGVYTLVVKGAQPIRFVVVR
jgi:fimbrial isopeptide formation D2 family protein